jgi:hypothetical protein
MTVTNAYMSVTNAYMSVTNALSRCSSHKQYVPLTYNTMCTARPVRTGITHRLCVETHAGYIGNFCSFLEQKFTGPTNA